MLPQLVCSINVLLKTPLVRSKYAVRKHQNQKICSARYARLPDFGLPLYCAGLLLLGSFQLTRLVVPDD